MASTKALLELWRVIREAPDDLFDMSAVTCGSAHCALGWAARDPWFQAHTTINNAIPADWQKTYAPPGSITEIGSEVFGIQRRDAERLFGHTLWSGDKVTKAEVLWNINELLRGRPARPYRASDLPAPWAESL